MSGVGRVAALGAVIAAVVLVAIVLFGGGSGGYKVTAKFINAGQIVKGNPVQTGGTPIGSVTGIKITDDGQAEIKLKIKDEHAPAAAGHPRAPSASSPSRASPTATSTSTYPPNGAEELDDGGTIGTDTHQDRGRPRPALQHARPRDPQGAAGLLQGPGAPVPRTSGKQANEAFQYLNPALATSSRLFNELTSDKPVLERFLVDSSQLVTALAERRDDLSGLIGNLNETTRALGNQKLALAESIERLPPFMRRANTTFVNLRAALDDVDPLVDASKPVAGALGPFLNQARAFAADAEPTVRTCARPCAARASDNDLIEFVNSVPPLADIAVETKQRNGENRRRARSRSRSRRSAARSPIIATGRPYTTGPPRLVRRLLHHRRRLRRARRLRPRPDHLPGVHRPIQPFLGHGEPAAGLGPPSATSSSAARAPPRRPPPTAPTCSRPRSASSSTATRAHRATGNLPMRRLISIGVRGAGLRAAPPCSPARERRAAQRQELQDRVRQRLRPGRGRRLPRGRRQRRRHHQVQGHRSDSPPKAEVTAEITEPGFGNFRKDASCNIKPQSLIGEYYVDCQPGTSSQKLKDGATVPVEQTESTIPQDLVNNILRRPYRERLRLIINELGTGLAGRPEDLQAVLKRAHPGLRETTKVLKILGDQNRVIENFIKDSDTVVAQLEARKQDVVALHRRGRRDRRDLRHPPRGARAAPSTSCPASSTSSTPTMARLEDLADEQIPLLRDARRAAPDLDAFLTRLGPFSEASRPAVRSLGEASEVGARAFEKGANEVEGAARAWPRRRRPPPSRCASSSSRWTTAAGRSTTTRAARSTAPARTTPRPTAARPPASPASSRSGTTSSGRACRSTASTTSSHLLRISVVLTEGPTGCSGYENDTPQNDPSLAQKFKECNQYLGPNQPGIYQPDFTAAAPRRRRSHARPASPRRRWASAARRASPTPARCPARRTSPSRRSRCRPSSRT